MVVATAWSRRGGRPEVEQRPGRALPASVARFGEPIGTFRRSERFLARGRRSEAPDPEAAGQAVLAPIPRDHRLEPVRVAAMEQVSRPYDGEVAIVREERLQDVLLVPEMPVVDEPPARVLVGQHDVVEVDEDPAA